MRLVGAMLSYAVASSAAVGSVFYLIFALSHGVSGPLAEQLISLTLATVAASILLHGASVMPAMKRYASRKTGQP